MPPFPLSSLPLPFRLGLAAVVLVLLGGLAVSASHLWLHHEKRDGRAGLTLDDLTGAYHGIQAVAPILLSLDRGHPEQLPAAERDALRRWLGLSDLAVAYDDTKAGDMAPAEILDRRCLSCHARDAKDGDGIGKKVPLEYWDDVVKQAESRVVQPNEVPIVVASAHTHALGMGSLTVVAILLAAGSRWSRRGTGALALLAGLGLCVDLACWLPAREFALLVPVLAGAGGLWAGCTGALLLAVLGDLLLPAPRAR
ncbi:MAG: hypothetical protein FJ265_17505 [Planctomycetes bacterium]|nr:hypothetical protein [Planctomycetota bacterium]